MKTTKFAFILFLLAPLLVNADNSTCDLSLIKSFQTIEESPLAYQISVFGFQVKFGGQLETWEAQNIDREALKRLFVTCAPGIVKCLKKKKRRKISGTIWADLEFINKNETLQLKSSRFSSGDTEKSGFYACAEEMVLKNGFPAGAAITSNESHVKARIPIIVTPTCQPVPADLQQDESCSQTPSSQNAQTSLPTESTQAEIPPAAPVNKVAPVMPIGKMLDVSNFKDSFAFTFWTDSKDKKNDLVSKCFKVTDKMLEKLSGYTSCERTLKTSVKLGQCQRNDQAVVSFFQKSGDCEKAQKQKGIAEEL